MSTRTDTPFERLLAAFRGRWGSQGGPHGARDVQAFPDAGDPAREDRASHEVITNGASASGDHVLGNGAPPWGRGQSGWTKDGENPFLGQRHEFHNRFYDLAVAKRNWQIMAMISMGLLVFVTVAYVLLASRSRITPYVVEVSELGIARAFGPAERMPMREMDRVVTAELSEFILNTRRIVADPVAQRDAILEAYAFVDKKARAFLNNYYSQPENDPRLLAQTIQRTIHVESILKIPDADSYRVRWTERERRHNSSSTVRSSWEAILAVTISPPESEETLQVNPLGIYVYDINWGRINQLQE